MLDQASNKVLDMEICQCTKAGKSNRMEKFAFIKALNRLKNENIKIVMLTTDRHSQIRKHMRDKEKKINHQFDVWHFCKNIKQKLNTVSQKASCNDLRPRIKSVAHHFWWACSKCEGDGQILREKWFSIIFHIQNIHHCTGFTKFRMCCHAPLSTEKQKKKNWLSPTSESFKTLQDIVFSNSILKDLSYLTKFAHTGTMKFITPFTTDGFQKAFISHFMA